MRRCKNMSYENLPEKKYVERLVNEYHYPPQEIQQEVTQSFGKARFRFDIVVLQQGKPYILVETKSSSKVFQSAIDQLLKYVKTIDVQFAVLTDGTTDKCFMVKRDSYESYLTEIPDIPPYGKTLNSIGQSHAQNLVAVSSDRINNLLFYFSDRLRNQMTPRDSLDQILKVLILKVYDEKHNSNLFRAAFNEPLENINSRIKILYSEAERVYPNLLREPIQLQPDILRDFIIQLQNYRLKDSLSGVVGSKLPFERLLGNISYESTSPQPLVKFIMDILTPKSGASFIDPACGVGGLLTEAATRGLKVTGIEISSDVSYLAEVNLALSGQEGRVINADSLCHRRDPSLSGFDYAAIVPPIGLKVSNACLVDFNLGNAKGAQNGDVLFTELTIGMLRFGGRAVLLVPQGFLFGSSFFEARKYLLQTCKLKAIIELPTGIFNPLTAIRTSLLLVEKSPASTRSTDGVYVASCESLTDFHEIAVSLKEFERTGKTDSGLAFVAFISDAKQLNVGYLKGTADRTESGDSTSIWPKLAIQSLCDIVTGARIEDIGTEDNEGTALYVRAGDVTDLLVDLESCKRVQPQFEITRYLGATDDILMTRAGTVGRVALVTPNKERLVLGSNVLKITVRDTSKLLPKYLLAVLRSDYGQKQIQMFTGGSTIRAISVSGLGQIEIPIPSIEEQQRIAEQIDKVIVAKIQTKDLLAKQQVKENQLFNELNESIGRVR